MVQWHRSTALSRAYSTDQAGRHGLLNRSAVDLIIFGVWSDHSQDQRNAAVMRDLWKPFDPFTGLLAAPLSLPRMKGLRGTYGDNTHTRLVELKNKYDPSNCST
jgi:hypothetical protein